LSATFAGDNKFNARTVITPEFGLGTRGGNVYARAVYGPNPGNTIEDLSGSEISLSGSALDTSFSLTQVGSTPPSAASFIELGFSRGTGGVSLTYGEGMSLVEFGDFAKKYGAYGLGLAKDVWEMCRN